MIISASYKTDIPAFYGNWFIKRLHAGYCKMVNPYNKDIYRVDLSPEAVAGFVFWTKNILPFRKHLQEIYQANYPFVVQYTINGYPRELEFSVVDAGRSIEQMRQLSRTYGPRAVVWRYDTIIFSSITPLQFHLRNFQNMAMKLEGTTDEVVVSFAQIYRKTLRNMNWAASEFGFMWEDPSDDTKLKLAIQLAAIATSHGMQLTMCAQPKYVVPGVAEARCVDVRRLSDVAGRPVTAALGGNRPDCGCFASKDIGEYDTCPHGCVYCYAVKNRELAQRRYKHHDPESEFLFAPPPGAHEQQSEILGPQKQLKILF